MKHGKGKMLSKITGEVYEGMWVADMREGQGVLFDPRKNLKFETIWHNNKLV